MFSNILDKPISSKHSYPFFDTLVNLITVGVGFAAVLLFIESLLMWIEQPLSVDTTMCVLLGNVFNGLYPFMLIALIRGSKEDLEKGESEFFHFAAKGKGGIITILAITAPYTILGIESFFNQDTIFPRLKKIELIEEYGVYYFQCVSGLIIFYWIAVYTCIQLWAHPLIED